MPSHKPIDIGLRLQASRSDLVDFKWSTNGISANFVIPDDDTNLLQILFNKPCIVRLLDEMPLSTEENPQAAEGLLPDHFAYFVEGAAFALAQSSAWQCVLGPVSHYRFITGWACMDVLTTATPTFKVVSISNARLHGL
jgi:hypothetical protein